MSDPTTITVTTANICGNPLRPRRFVKKRMRRALRIPGVTMGQEVARSNRWRRGNYNRMWRRVAAVYGKRTVGGPYEVPISAPSAWTLVDRESIEVHPGKRGVSPARRITVAKYLVGGHKVALVNCHPVSKPRWGVPFARWRMSRWDEYHAELRDTVSALRHDDYSVVFGGDMNKRRRANPQVHPRQQPLISSGLDHLWVVPAVRTSATVTHRRKIHRTVLMDHPILTVTFELRSAA